MNQLTTSPSSGPCSRCSHYLPDNGRRTAECGADPKHHTRQAKTSRKKLCKDGQMFEPTEMDRLFPNLPEHVYYDKHKEAFQPDYISFWRFLSMVPAAVAFGIGVGRIIQHFL